MSNVKGKNAPIDIPEPFTLMGHATYDESTKIHQVYGAIHSDVLDIPCLILRHPKGWNKVVPVFRCVVAIKEKQDAKDNG